MQKKDIQHVFLVGAKSLGTYGGYETFINKLTEQHQENKKIKYHVACKANGDGSKKTCEIEGAEIISEDEFIYHNAHCFRIKIPEKLGSAQAIYYDIMALKTCCTIIRKKRIQHPIIYIMACRIGPFINHYYKEIHKLGGKIYLNPDGHEWMRAKWNKPIQKYWKISEQLMVKYSDLVICDSINIEKYIHKSYDGRGIKKASPKTVFIAYGAETRRSKVSDDDEKLLKWYKDKGLEAKEYYLVVGRFVPENNYEIMIREFMKSNSNKKLAIITNVNDKFLEELKNKLSFGNDERIKFVGTVYEQELLMKIRENAFAYLHGHEVGGTNPSLLEALGSTNLNLLLDVGFNREVAEDNAFYWKKEDNSLVELINKVELLTEEQCIELGNGAKKRIEEKYSWKYIATKYEECFMGE